MTPIIVKIATKGGGALTKTDKALINKVSKIYSVVKKEMNIRRNIPIIICDEWTWNDHLHMNPQSIAHYNYSDQLFLRRNAFRHEIGKIISLEDLLKHELIHAKLKGKETKSHNAAYKKLAKKSGLPKKHWVRSD